MDRKFETFLLDNDADYVDVVMFTSVRCLSRSAFLKNSITFFRRLKCYRSEERHLSA